MLECLRAELGKANVSLRFVHGQPTPSELKKMDEGHLPWAEVVTNRYWRVGGKDLCWQMLPKDTRTADLVILNQENSLLSNLPILLNRAGTRPQLAFFGHGANLQSNRPDGVRERFKRWTTNHVDWWFAYTSMSADLVAASGFSRHRVTNVENAVDTSALRAEVEGITEAELTATRTQLDLVGKQVALFLGSLYSEKRLDLLIEAADHLHSKDANFRLLVVGDGPLRDEITNACKLRPWCVWVGAKTGRAKALYLRLADVMVNPGVVGLGILDAFSAGVPMVTTDTPGHGPEIAYLRHNENGLVAANNVLDFVQAVSALLADRQSRSRLAAACRRDASRYTAKNMAKRFAAGIVQCLASQDGKAA